MPILLRLAAAWVCLVFSASSFAATCTPQREAVTVALPDFASPAEIVSRHRGSRLMACSYSFPGPT